jgi:hypothetical protein
MIGSAARHGGVCGVPGGPRLELLFFSSLSVGVVVASFLVR